MGHKDFLGKSYAKESLVKNVSIFFKHIISGKDGYVEITEWHNGEGVTVTISDIDSDKNNIIELYWEQLAALTECASFLFRD